MWLTLANFKRPSHSFPSPVNFDIRNILCGIALSFAYCSLSLVPQLWLRNTLYIGFHMQQFYCWYPCLNIHYSALDYTTILKPTRYTTNCKCFSGVGAMYLLWGWWSEVCTWSNSTLMNTPISQPTMQVSWEYTHIPVRRSRDSTLL